MNRPLTFILLGPPGSGKSTQASALVREMGFFHIDIGSALRKASETDSSLGRKIAEIMNQHMGLVSDDIVKEVLLDAFSSIPKEASVVIDGAPRRLSQIALVEQAVSECGRTIDGVLFVNISEEESVRRISCRWMCTPCGRSFVAGVDFPTGKEQCPSCGGILVRRKDDTEEGVRKRFRIFFSETTHVVEAFRMDGRLFEIDGTASIDVITDGIRRYVEKFLYTL